MNAPRIVTNHKGDEAYPNVWVDFEWAAENRQALLNEYGECIVLIFQKEVVGVGQTLQAAEEDAERRLPPEADQITPITYFLGYPHRIHSVSPQPSTKS